MPHDQAIEMLDLDVEVLHEYHRNLISWVGSEAADRPRIVDLGAGSGTGALALARELPGSEITAVDVSAEMLAHVRSRARAADLGDRIHTIEADLDRPWPDFGPTDVVWAASSMHHMADPAHALASAFGVLRPGGLLVIAELDSFPHFLAGTPDEDVEERGHAQMAHTRQEAGLHMHEDWADRITHAGFTSLTERHVEIDLRPPLPAATARYAEICLRRMSHGLAGRLSPSELDTLAAVVAGLHGRDDIGVRTERTVWLARR